MDSGVFLRLESSCRSGTKLVFKGLWCCYSVSLREDVNPVRIVQNEPFMSRLCDTIDLRVVAMIKIADKVEEILTRMDHHGIEAYLVGGYVRDLLMNKKSFDVDIAFAGSLDHLIAILNDFTLNTAHTALGTLQFQYGDYQFECTHLRLEKDYDNQRYPNTITLTTDILEDLKRRDFTMNAIAYHHKVGFIDPYQGRVAIEERSIIMIEDPRVRLQEDLLRVFRALRFQSQIGFTLDGRLEEAIQDYSLNLRRYPCRYWQKEFEKLLLGDYFLEMAMSHSGFFHGLFGFFEDAYQFDQRNPYHLYSLYEHTMRVVSNVPKNIRLRYAALFHDLGKLETEVHDDFGVSHYAGHAEASYYYAQDLLEQFTMKQKDKLYILDLIRYHGIRMSQGIQSVYEIVHQFGFEFAEDLIALKRADNMSKSDKALYQVVKCDQFTKDLTIIKNEQWPLKVADLKVGFHDLKTFDVPLKMSNQVLKEVLNRVVMETIGNDYKKQYEVLQEVVLDVIH